VIACEVPKVSEIFHESLTECFPGLKTGSGGSKPWPFFLRPCSKGLWTTNPVGSKHGCHKPFYPKNKMIEIVAQDLLSHAGQELEYQVESNKWNS
jgi:hypothetical protein